MAGAPPVSDSLEVLDGGAKSAVSAPARFSLASLWAILGVSAFLGHGVMHMIPDAIRPLKEGMGPSGWAAYVSSAMFFGYMKGYRGFQRSFSPLVVRRALLLDSRSPALRQALAPAYAMAFFHTTRKRKLVGLGMMLGLGAIIPTVKRLPYPQKSIVDVGVCLGLSWGIGAILGIYFEALRSGKAPLADPCLPAESA